MVVRQRQRQYQARHETAVLEHRTPLTTGDAEDRDLGRVDDRREERSADRAEARYREHAALHLVRTELAVARARRQLAELLRNLVDVLAVDVANDGNDETVLRIDREAEMRVALHHEVLAVRRERRLEVRELVEHQGARPQDERQRREPDAALLGLRLERVARLLERRDIGLVVLRDVRQVDPARVQPCAGDALDARQRLVFDLAELREIDLGHGRQGRAGRGRAAQDRLDVGLDVLGTYAAFHTGAAHAAEID